MLFLLTTGPKFCSLLEKGFLILITVDIVMLLLRGPIFTLFSLLKGFLIHTAVSIETVIFPAAVKVKL
jgi:hypothetical protein